MPHNPVFDALFSKPRYCPECGRVTYMREAMSTVCCFERCRCGWVNVLYLDGDAVRSRELSPMEHIALRHEDAQEEELARLAERGPCKIIRPRFKKYE